jgi:predicted HicB family RNase H-like nuclease
MSQSRRAMKGRAFLNIPVSRELHRAIRLEAVRQETSVAELVRMAVAEKYGLPYELTMSNSTPIQAPCDR